MPVVPIRTQGWMPCGGNPLRFGVVRFPGSCDEVDALEAAQRVGEAEILWYADRDLRGADAVIVPGGFSYGDYLRVGAIARFAPVMEEVERFARSGGPVLGICNGFQVLCEAGLLPGALLPNTSLRFLCKQVALTVVNDGTAWTRACSPGDSLSIPIKHTTGRYYAPDPVLDEMEAQGQVVLRYAPGETPPGSLRDIAGAATAAGNVLGLMPHPEHAVDPLTGSVDGLKLFESVVRNVAGRSELAQQRGRRRRRPCERGARGEARISRRAIASSGSPTRSTTASSPCSSA